MIGKLIFPIIYGEEFGLALAGHSGQSILLIPGEKRLCWWRPPPRDGQRCTANRVCTEAKPPIRFHESEPFSVVGDKFCNPCVAVPNLMILILYITHHNWFGRVLVCIPRLCLDDVCIHKIPGYNL